MTSYPRMAEFAYPHLPIGSIDALARHLRLEKERLERAVSKVGPNAYRVRKVTPSEIRGIPDKVEYAPKPWLKELQRLLNSRLLRSVDVPRYVVGGVPGRRLRDAVERHTYAQSLLAFDISRFFESTKADEIRRVFKHLFCFPPEVVEVLVKLTTFEDHLPRGAPTSSYLANLVFFEDEPGLFEWLSDQRPHGLRYSRWVDDMNITSPHPIDAELVESVKAQVTSMLRRRGLEVNWTKHRALDRVDAIEVHNIRIRRTTLSVAKWKRRALRAGINVLSRASSAGPLTVEELEKFNALASRVGYIQHFHPREMKRCRSELDAILTRHRASGGLLEDIDPEALESAALIVKSQ